MILQNRNPIASVGQWDKRPHGKCHRHYWLEFAKCAYWNLVVRLVIIAFFKIVAVPYYIGCQLVIFRIIIIPLNLVILESVEIWVWECFPLSGIESHQNLLYGFFPCIVGVIADQVSIEMLVLLVPNLCQVNLNIFLGRVLILSVTVYGVDIIAETYIKAQGITLSLHFRIPQGVDRCDLTVSSWLNRGFNSARYFSETVRELDVLVFGENCINCPIGIVFAIPFLISLVVLYYCHIYWR